MAQDNLIDLKKPEASVNDPITDISRQDTRQILTTELEAEIQGFLATILRANQR